MTTLSSPESPAPARARPARIPLIAPAESRVYDLAQAARRRGCRLVHDGKGLFLTPIVLPGQFIVAEAA